jgi:hypothetical protein
VPQISPDPFRIDSFRSADDARNRLNLTNRTTALVSSKLRTIVLALKSNSTRRAGAIFVTSRDEPRIREHFRRLQKQTEGLLDLNYIVNKSDFPEPECSLSYVSPKKIMPRRMQRMLENGGMYEGGFVDVLVVPLALALKNEFVWIIEYDVDFSGDWGDFFRQFETDRSDVLTTSLITRAQSLEWVHWETARPPPEVPQSQHLRSYNPIMRLSQRFLKAYVRETARRDWSGQYEYTIPTIANCRGYTIADIGGKGEFCPRCRHGRNYTNSPEEDPYSLSPGTFVFLPRRYVYFSENSADFPQADMLYHPVKG